MDSFDEAILKVLGREKRGRTQHEVVEETGFARLVDLSLCGARVKSKNLHEHLTKSTQTSNPIKKLD